MIKRGQGKIIFPIYTIWLENYLDDSKELFYIQRFIYEIHGLFKKRGVISTNTQIGGGCEYEPFKLVNTNRLELEITLIINKNFGRDQELFDIIRSWSSVLSKFKINGRLANALNLTLLINLGYDCPTSRRKEAYKALYFYFAQSSVLKGQSISFEDMLSLAKLIELLIKDEKRVSYKSKVVEYMSRVNQSPEMIYSSNHSLVLYKIFLSEV